MDREVALFIQNLEQKKVMTKASMTFYSGSFDGSKTVVVKCGVGKVNAAMCTQILIDIFEPDAIICTGIAGALSPDLDIGDTVISSDVVQYDVDSTGFGHELGEIPNLGKKYFKASQQIIDMAVKVHKDYFRENKFFVGRILTGDQFVSSKDKTEMLRRTFNGLCVEMEGGAIGQVCYLNNTPFVIIRTISDKADGSAITDYEKFADVTANKSFHIVSGIVKLLKLKE
ncbi:MAG: 5'-methylthioadenosine/adenosylhomocysteine nucleosidase [Thermoanaerobacterales bacterium]|nr:5'-methylthioadenosine/adenosylhomocysteine nucleosidase [Thermoanaerobacterales bacterium]